MTSLSAMPACASAVAEELGTEGMASTYNFHNLYSVSVAHRGLDELMKRELGIFLEPVGKVDLIVEEGPGPEADMVLLGDYSYDDAAFVLRVPGGRVRVSEGSIRAEPQVEPWALLAQWVENYMKNVIVRRGACFAHASAVSRDGTGILLPGWMGTGKTDAAIALVARGYDYMADDWCFVSETGQILAYPRWISLFAYHFDSQPHLMSSLDRTGKRRDLRRQLAATRFASSMRGSNSIVRRFRQFLSDRFYVYERAAPSLIVPGSRIAMHARVSKVCLLVASRRSEVEVSDLAPEDLARRVVQCGEYERRAFSAHRSAMGYAGHRSPVPDTSGAEANLLTRAFKSARCVKVTIPAERRDEGLADVVSRIEEA